MRTFSLGPTDTKLDQFWCIFIMAKGEILIPVDTDGFLDPKLWGVVNAHIFLSMDQQTPSYTHFGVFS